LNTRVNFDIKANRVLLISEDGDKLGIFSRRDAIERAEESNLDLVQVSGDQEIPVCKILDYGKMQYEQKKNAKGANSSKVVVKEIRFGPATGENDINVKIKAANAFLDKGHHVRLVVKLKGRANTHKDIVVEKVTKFIEQLKGTPDSNPYFAGNICSVLVVP
jgi:translation initiation factor IF-3